MTVRYDPSRVSAWTHGINVALLSGLFVGSVLAFDGLPGRIPTHFGLSGVPDAWSDTTLLRWLTLPIVAVALSALLYGCAWLMARFPDKMNVPDQKRFDALPLDKKREVRHVVQRFLFVLTAVGNLMMLGLQTGTLEVALGASNTLPWYALAGIVGMIVVSPIGVVWLMMVTQRVSRAG